jgi:CRISPR-associated protein Cpf1
MFSTEWFSKTLTQSGIDLYNKMIGGESLEDGKKIQGFNEKVNLFRQANKLDGKSVPMLKQLKKQILGDKNVPAWITEGFKN